MRELGEEITWESFPERDAIKADLLCRLEQADQELQMGLEWDDTGLKNGAIEDMREVLEEVRHNLTINSEGKEQRLKQAEKDLKAFAKNMNGLKAASEIESFHNQILAILDGWN